MAYKVIFVIYALCFVMLTACSGANNAAEASWLHGTWQVSHNPKNDDEDDMVFMADGKVLIKTQQGDLVGHYAVEGRLLRMLITVNGKPVPTEFRVSQNNAKLIFKNGAEYSRKVP
ncbi:MAG: hypothetical protein JKY90_00630 [Gammaproteobacteria bacterium]|nr:hypothetical protein [Gammaproteobacteria bacterium]